MLFHRFVTRSYDITQTASLYPDEIREMCEKLNLEFPLPTDIDLDWDAMQAIWDYLDENNCDIDEDADEVTENIYDYGTSN